MDLVILKLNKGHYDRLIRSGALAPGSYELVAARPEVPEELKTEQFRKLAKAARKANQELNDYIYDHYGSGKNNHE